MTKFRAKGPVDFKHTFAKIYLDGEEEWDRTKSVGASEVFGCLRRAYFAKREPDKAEEAEHPDDIEFGYAERGNQIERKYAVPKLQEMFGEENCFLMGDRQKTFQKGNLSATPDGIILDQPRDALAKYGVADLGSDEAQFAPEIKSFDPRMNLSKGAKPRHIGQSIVQQGIFNECTNYYPQHGVVLYINCSNLKDVRPYAVSFDPVIYARAHARADDVFDMSKGAGDYRSEGKITGECVNCPFVNACNKVEMALFPDEVIPIEMIDPAVKAEMETLAREVANIRSAYNDLEEKKKTAEADLRERMFQSGTTRMGDKDWSVSISKNGGRKTLDKSAMLDAGLDPDDYMRQGNAYYVMRVKAGAKKG